MTDASARTSTLAFARRLLAPVATYSFGLAIFSLVPLMIGVLIDKQFLTDSQAGMVAGIEMLATVTPGFLLGSLLPGVAQRTLLTIGSLVAATCNMLTPAVTGFEALALIRAASGLGTGLLFACGNSMLASTNDPVRAYGYASIGATVSGAALLFGVPLLITRFGSAGYFGTVAIAAAIFVPVGLRAPREPLASVVPAAGAGTWSVGSLRLALLLLGVVLLTIPLEAYWGFAERIGLRTGASPEYLGAVFALSYVGGVVAASLASCISTRWGLMRMLALGFALQALAIMAACVAANKTVVLGSMLFQTVALCFGAPFLFGLGAEADDSGRFASIVVGLFYATLAVGTLVGGLLVSSSGFGAIAILTAVFTILGLAAVLPASMAVRAHRRLEGKP